VLSQCRFPAESIVEALLEQASAIPDPLARSGFEALITPLRDSVLPYTRGKTGVPGSQRAVDSFVVALVKWTSNERWFCDGKAYADAVEDLRHAYKNDLALVLGVCRAHAQLSTTSALIVRIISSIGVGTKINPSGGSGTESVILSAESVISEIGAMGTTDAYREVSLKARKLLMQESLPSLELRKRRFLGAATDVATTGSGDLPASVEDLLADQTPMIDLLFPLLKSTPPSMKIVGLAEIFLRRMYRSFVMNDFVRNVDARLVKFSFTEKQAEGALINLSTVTSLVDLKRVVSSGSLKDAEESSESGSVLPAKQGIPADTVRCGVCMVVDELDDISDTSKLASLWEQFHPASGADPVNVVYFVVLASDIDLDEVTQSEVSLVGSPTSRFA
jgi:Acetyl-CoA carboxylase, central region